MSQSVHSPYESMTFGNSLSLRVDGAIGAMSLSPNGRDAVLAGRRGLFIIDLDDPFTTPRWLHHITSWEVADVQWSPHHNAKPSWCISTSNQKALLWDLSRPSDNAISNVLHHHTRAITDINFHPFDPEVIATSSIDTFIYSWDMRTPRKPVAQWAEWRAGTTQVKWNHANPFEIASSHDNSFYIWDSRNGSLPLLKVNKAHNGKINGLDFSNGISNIITCSNDKSIRFWDLGTDKAKRLAENFNFFDSQNANKRSLDPNVIINADFPVARARNLPFGKDKACGVMPLRGGQDSIHIINVTDAFELARETGKTQTITADPVHSFKGHTGPVKDFLWRRQHENYENIDKKRDWKEYQLVTWSSSDFDLKLWPRDDLYEKVNYNPTHQKILDALINEESDSEDVSKSSSLIAGDVETITDNDSDGQLTPNGQNKVTYKYNTYCTEPPITIDDLKKSFNGDVLSSIAKFKLNKSQRQNNPSQLNHLDWISGVRIGHTNNREKDANMDEEDGPTNLGEEVSIVGHKFPKIRFEKISVSTGHLVVSLRGPIPIISSGSEPAKKHEEPSANSEREAKRDSKTESISITASAPNMPGQGTNPNNSVSNDDTSVSQQHNSTAGTNEETTQEQKLVFIRLEVRLPKAYPYLENLEKVSSTRRRVKLQKTNTIKFDIEETHELTTSIKKDMLKNLEDISQFFSNKYNKFCLEPCLRYLLGDKIELSDSLMAENTGSQSNDDSIDDSEVIQEVGTEGWADDLINQQPDVNFNSMKDDSSSSEDEDDSDLIPVKKDNLTGSAELDEFENAQNDSAVDSKGGSQNASPNNTFDSTPIPKGCGAVWSHTGQLVCFLTPKTNEGDKSIQKFSTFKFSEGGFTLKTQSDSSSSESSDSEFDDEDDHSGLSDTKLDYGSDNESFTSSSSDDSFSKDWDEILQNDVPSRSRIPGLFKTAVGLGNRYISHGNNKSSLNRLASQGGTASNYRSSAHGDTTVENPRLSKKRSRRRKKNTNIVSIFDFSHLIPDKFELACEYRVLGDYPENLAKYNSFVAQKYGLTEISDVWRILEMVLIKDVKVNDIHAVFRAPVGGQKTPANTPAMNQLLRGSDIGKKILTNAENNYRFYWGTHPFGNTWLIQEIIRYFEMRGNVQMLAMLSCILFENESNMKKSTSDFFNIPVNTPYQTTPPIPSIVDLKEFNSPVQDEEYYRLESDPFKSSFHDSTSINKTGRTQQPNDSSFSSHRKGIASEINEFNRSLGSSIDGASFKDFSPNRHHSLKRNIQHQSLTPFSDLSPANEYSLSQLRSHPKHQYDRKSPSSLYQGTPKKQKQVQQRRPQASGTTNRNRIRPPPLVTIEMMNTDTLDLFDDTYNSTLLNSQENEKIKAYREQYAEMLFAWGLPINRIKILKFNYPNSDNIRTKSYQSPFDVHNFMFGLRESPAQDSENMQHIVPDTTIYTAQKNSWNANRKSLLKYCSLCNLLVDKRVVVCTSCEHVMHSDCALNWWSSEENFGDAECPSGCSCKCLEHNI